MTRFYAKTGSVSRVVAEGTARHVALLSAGSTACSVTVQLLLSLLPVPLSLLRSSRRLRSAARDTMSFFSASTSNSLVNNNAADKDIEVADPPTDSISAVAFSPTADYLAVGSWDNNVRDGHACLRGLGRTDASSRVWLGSDIRSWR